MTARTALITGAARRLGAAIARSLHSQGHLVIIHYNKSSDAAKALTNELNTLRANSAYSIQADLNQSDEVKTLAEQARQIDNKLSILINNASSFYPHKLGEINETIWQDLQNSNLKAPFFLSQALAGTLSAQKGCIVNISDIFAQRPRHNYSAYCIAKAGNDMMTKALALELAPAVRVNGIAPGAILLPENQEPENPNSKALAPASHALKPKILEAVPLNKMGGEESIVETVNFLVNSANYITGQIIPVDGGRTLMQ